MHFFGLILVGVGFLGLILWASFHGWDDDDWEDDGPRPVPPDDSGADDDPDADPEGWRAGNGA